MEPGLDALRGAALQLREVSATKGKKEAERAQQEVSGLPSPIQVIAEKNVVLSSELQEQTRKEAQIVERLDATQRYLNRIKSEADSTHQQADIVGPSEAIGRMLRKRAASLPSFESYRRDTRQRR